MDESILAFVDIGDDAITTIADRAGWCRLVALNRVTIMHSAQDAKLFSRVTATWNVALRSSRFPQLPAKQLCDQSARGAHEAVVIAEGAHRTPLLEGVLGHVAAVAIETIPSGNQAIALCEVTSANAVRHAPVSYHRRSHHGRRHHL